MGYRMLHYKISKKRWFLWLIITVLFFLYSQSSTIVPGEVYISNDNNPYLQSATANPYLGWQWQQPIDSNFTWRSCFKDEILPDGCLEYDLGEAPMVNESWIPDVTMIRTMLMYGKDKYGDPFPPILSQQLCEDIGVGGISDGDVDKECISKTKIRSLGNLDSTTVIIDPSNHFDDNAVKSNSSGVSVVVPAPKLMCLIYTMADAHANKIRGIRDTWAGGCDGFLAFSTESDPRIPSLKLDHDGPESYGNMWQKIRSIWKFVGTHYLDDFDWFFIGGDDVFLLPYNLKAYMASLAYKDETNPRTHDYYIGRRMNGGKKLGYFNYGGPGYALSQMTLRRLLPALDDAKHCSANEQTPAEDVIIAKCLGHLGITFTDTRDAKGRERFFPFSPGWHYNFRSPGPPDQGAFFLYRMRRWKILEGKDCCAPDSISFHYIKQASLVRHLHAMFNYCDEHDENKTKALE